MTDKEEREVLRRYLRQYLSAKRRKCDLERRRAQLQQDMQCPLGAVRYDGMPRSSSPSEGAAAFAYRIDEVEQRICAQQDEMARAALEIMDIIDFLEPGSLEREVIEKRYMDGMGWHAIERDIPISRSQGSVYETRAIDTLRTYAKVRSMVGLGAGMEKSGYEPQ